MHIVHIASELAPIAKIGGLADVVLGLSRELSWKNQDVDIILPKYDCMDTDAFRDLTVETENLLSYYDGEWHSNTVWVGWLENLKVYLIDPKHPRHFFHRGCIYGCEDDIARYLYFSRAALEFLYKKGISPDIIHLHDWQTAAIAPLYKDLYSGYGYDQSKIIFTIHNINYQGHCYSADIQKIGLHEKAHLSPDGLQDPRQPEMVNLLKGGIVYSDAFTTVSPCYAQEIATTERGEGLEKVVQKYSNKLHGILNGVDYSYWNPELDPHLPTHYSPREVPENKDDRNTIDKKAFIKKKLRERLMHDERHRPIIGCVSRLVPQKGLELIKHTLYRTLELGGQFVLLGSSPIPSIEAEFHRLRQQFSDHPHVSLTLVPNEETTHMIFAGSDLFIVPSLFEPCGLVQLIALKYGAVPIVRETGGLSDTIFDLDHSSRPKNQRNGFTFKSADKAGVDSALDRAFQCWFDRPDEWRKLMIQGMEMDYSWQNPTKAYLKLYQKTLGLLSYSA